MERASLLAASYALDWLIGDPEWMPHPVRTIGWTIRNGERIIRRLDSGKRWELVAGCILAVFVTAISALVAWRTIRKAYARDRVFGTILEIWLGSTCLATRNLLDESAQIIRILNTGDLSSARRQLARIVGRDTASLDESDICRAVIETLAESLSDGIIAPLVYFALGGVPAAVAYKAVNTLDSMIGHRDAKYLRLGCVAARLDDLANWIPARMTGALICIASAVVSGRASGLRAGQVWLRDGSHHASPNAGQVESAMAGALAVRLGGANYYDGDQIISPHLGAEFKKPDRSRGNLALRIVTAASLLGFAAIWLFAKRIRHGG
jgi:adenosylcobinamide-phosphate synthase